MKVNFNKPKQFTLSQIFNRKLLLLLVFGSILMNVLIALTYRSYTESLNQTEMNNRISLLVNRLINQNNLENEAANSLVGIMHWSGALNFNTLQQNEKLRVLFIAQAKSFGIDGIVIRDNQSNELLFNFWTNNSAPDFANQLNTIQSLWFDQGHNVLYTHIKKSLAVDGKNFTLDFFKAWDSEMLRSVTPQGTTTFVTLGSQALLSSAGSLALEAVQPAANGYAEYLINGVRYQESSNNFGIVTVQGGEQVPLKLVVRNPLKNSFSLLALIATSLCATLIFAGLLFSVFSRWLGRISHRLDLLSKAAVRFKNDTTADLKAEISQLLEQANGGRHDQISMVAQQLLRMIDTLSQRTDEQHSYLQTLDLLHDAVIELSTDGKLLRATDAFKTLTGGTDFNACSIEQCVHADDSGEVLEQISGLVYEQKQQINIRFRIRRHDDPSAHFWVEGRFAPIKQNNQVLCIRGVLRDINNSYKQERQISHMALHDALTGLPNRVLLEDRMDLAIARAQRNKQRVALGFIDLDHFKQINDNFGHKVGDLMLKEVTQRLQSALRSSDTLSRWGGDEFVVLCPDLSSLEDARDLTQKLSLLTHKNIRIDGTDFPFTFSAGFAVYPDDANNNEMLMAQADRAMFYAKAQGRNNIQFFNVIAAKEKGRQSFYIQSRLAKAIQDNNIQIWLQPLICTRSGKVMGAEVLARWFEEEQGWIPPSVFIPMAESLGLIEKLGLSVWQQTLHAFTLLPNTHRLSVNLSKRQLFSNHIVQQFCDDTAQANIAPSRIMLEITESLALSDVEYARERIAELDAYGFGIAVDDFGVGYSSLAQLHEIPADELKLDSSFVHRIHEKTGYGMISAMVAIAKSLELQTVAEGVEDEATASLLISLGVDILQGHHFAKPMPLEDYLAWLKTREATAP